MLGLRHVTFMEMPMWSNTVLCLVGTIVISMMMAIVVITAMAKATRMNIAIIPMVAVTVTILMTMTILMTVTILITVPILMTMTMVMTMSGVVLFSWDIRLDLCIIFALLWDLSTLKLQAEIQFKILPLIKQL